MAIKIYKAIWALFFASAGILFLTGNLNLMTGVVFGFIGFGVIFFGMISVLPATVGHNAPRQIPQPKPLAEPVKEGYAPVKSATVH